MQYLHSNSSIQLLPLPFPVPRLLSFLHSLPTRFILGLSSQPTNGRASQEASSTRARVPDAEAAAAAAAEVLAEARATECQFPGLIGRSICQTKQSHAEGPTQTHG